VFAELKDVVAGIAASTQQAIHLEARYRELVTRLTGLYRPHIQFEDEVLMPLARRILDRGEMENISQEMRGRRQKGEGDSSMDELARRVLEVFIEMGSESLDLHTLFEAGGNGPASRERVLDVVMRLVDTGHLESRSGDFYLLTGKGRSAAG
jgi:hypothetical protein